MWSASAVALPSRLVSVESLKLASGMCPSCTLCIYAADLDRGRTQLIKGAAARDGGRTVPPSLLIRADEVIE
jgi:hypothetical protein